METEESNYTNKNTFQNNNIPLKGKLRNHEEFRSIRFNRKWALFI